MSTQEHVRFFFEDLKQILATHSEVYVGVTGGVSLDGFYREVAASWVAIDLTRIHFYLSDERVTEIKSEKNIAHLDEVFFTPLSKKTGVTPQVYVPEFAGKFPFPRSDLLLLSAGPDGHIASLFPGHSQLEDKTWSYLEVTDSPKPPSKRITMSPEVIRRSFSVFVFFLGVQKQAAFGNRESLPARIAIHASSPDQQRRIFNF